MKPEVKEFLIIIGIALIVTIAFHFSLQISPVRQTSMEPNLHEGQVLIINKLAYDFGGEPKRGDIIIFIPPNAAPGTEYVKRVIGLPGEVVEVRNGSVYIHKGETSFRLNEDYVYYPPLYDYISEPIPPGHYFVLGDNRANSLDSRNGWTVPEENIVGKAWLIVWPPSNWGGAPNYSFPMAAENSKIYSEIWIAA